MKVFEKPNLSRDWKCPVCKTSDVKPITLVGIAGTEDDGIIECEQFHIDCMEPVWHKDQNVVGFSLRE